MLLVMASSGLGRVEAGEKAAATPPDLDPEFTYVTCGSFLKLAHQTSGHHLHSHEIHYATGSERQSVTAADFTDDPNSLWRVSVEGCARGSPIQCGQVVRLRHSATHNYLHSGPFTSPLTSQQEVSAIEGEGTDAGAAWAVECVGNEDDKSLWQREQPIRLKHVDSSSWLASDKAAMYGRPIQGQLEVVTTDRAGDTTVWLAQEGVYFTMDTSEDKLEAEEDQAEEGDKHDEL
ncbi:MAG: MIR motif-containing protein [Piptocephalis tieghemiana]|nr:MAG: MIR motif-containing protein [Piptocephalis tieghemiana]